MAVTRGLFQIPLYLKDLLECKTKSNYWGRMGELDARSKGTGIGGRA